MITIFIDSDYRPPRKGEWFIRCDGDYVQAKFDYDKDIPVIIKTGYIDLPKKKVKKWFIEMTTSREQIITPKESYTDEEIRHLMDDYPYTKFRRIKEIEE